jgi:hypothetical protein
MAMQDQGAQLRDLPAGPGHHAYAARLLRDPSCTPAGTAAHAASGTRRADPSNARAVGLDHSTVSKSLRRMQDAGLLTREPLSKPARVVRAAD